MNILKDFIKQVPWNKLAHAYNSAWDVPENLEKIIFTSSDDELEEAIDWFWGAILHQGSVYSASIPAVWILIEVIKKEPKHKAVASILSFIGTIADLHWNFEQELSDSKPVYISSENEPLYAVFVHKPLPIDFEDDEESYFTASQLYPTHIKQLCVKAIPIVINYLNSENADIQREVVNTSLNLMKLLPNESKPLKVLFKNVGNSSFCCSTWVNLGMECQDKTQVISWLDSNDERLILVGALNPLSIEHPKSLPTLCKYLPRVKWNSDNFSGLVGHLHFRILHEIVSRTNSNDPQQRIIDAMVMLIKERAKNTSFGLSDFEIYPILHWAFEERIAAPPFVEESFAPLPTRLTKTQYSILNALCAEKNIWNPTNGNMHLAYASVHLPYNQKKLEALVQGLT